MAIVAKIRGGLGNQLFQAAAMAHFAEKWSRRIVLDDVAIIRHPDKSRRSWLRKINLESLFLEPNLRWRNHTFSYLRSVFSPNVKDGFFLDEAAVNRLEVPSQSLEIHGFFMSKLYLPRQSMKIHENTFKEVHPAFMRVVDKNRNNDESAGLHVRLGDFKNTPWGSLRRDWYVKALNLLIKDGISQIDCYSDDLRELEEILDPLRGKLHFRFPEKEKAMNPHELLLVLSSYNNYVSSNSSLSWWASYLNQSFSPKIICQWEEHLFMEGWNYLSV